MFVVFQICSAWCVTESILANIIMPNASHSYNATNNQVSNTLDFILYDKNCVLYQVCGYSHTVKTQNKLERGIDINKTLLSPPHIIGF